MSDARGLEPAIVELRDLGKRKPLKDQDLARAKQLMSQLRSSGFKNQEIADLTGWSAPTVKLYTRATTVQDPRLREEATKLLGELVSQGLTIPEVAIAVTMNKELNSKGLSLQDLSSFLEESKSIKAPLRDMVQLHKDSKTSGLSTMQLRDALNYKSELDKAGFTVEGLKTVLKASVTYGGYLKVLEAIDSYGLLETIKVDIGKLDGDRKNLEDRVAELNEVIEQLSKKRAEINSAIELYKSLESIGFDEDSLRELHRASSKYGGVDPFLEAMNLWKNVEEMNDYLDHVAGEKTKLDVEMEKLRINHAHLQTVVGMCDKLIYELKFSVAAIEQFYVMAKKYGEPINVIRALDNYAESKALEKDVRNLVAQRNKLTTEIGPLQKQAQDLRDVTDVLRNSTNETLSNLSSEVAKAVDSVKAAFNDASKSLGTTYNENLSAVAKSYDDLVKRLGDLREQAGELAEVVTLARALRGIAKRPSSAKDIRFDYAVEFLDAAYSICAIKAYNPKVKATEALQRDYCGLPELDVLRLMEWTRKGLTSEAALGK